MAADSEPLSSQDLSFWYIDQPQQRTTMAMLLRLDRPPDSRWLRGSVMRAVEAVPRLRQRIVDAPFELARPRWENDPTFDLDFHVRRYALTTDTPGAPATLEDLFRTIGPIYERPFDPTRPLWELIELDGPGPQSSIFFRLHHAVADGVGGNAILAALTDAERDVPVAPADKPEPPGAWDELTFGTRLRAALRDRAAENARRARALMNATGSALRSPSKLGDAARMLGSLLADANYTTDSPLEHFGRARHLSGIDLPFQPLREARDVLGGKMIDVLLTGVAGAVGEWHRKQGLDVAEVLTLVPINLRARSDQGMAAGTGNRATGVTVRLPLDERDPVRRFKDVHRRVEERKAHPAVTHMEEFADILSVLPRALYRSLALATSGSVNLIVTNVPGIMMPRYVAGAKVLAGYPFAPVAPRCPVSVALYGYDGRLYVGLDADGTSMPDVEDFRQLLAASFEELLDAAGVTPRD